MDSTEHALSSIIVGLLAGIGLGEPTAIVPWLVAFAAILGVGIDLDHFLLARLNTGSWRALQSCLRDPMIVFFDRESIFIAGEVGKLPRLLSHVVIGGALVAIFAFTWSHLAILSALVLYVHLVLDLIQDVRDEWLA